MFSKVRSEILSSKRLISTLRIDDPWKVGRQCKQLIGSRTVIVSSNKTNKAIVQRLWYELSLCQIQPTSITLPTALPILPSHANTKGSLGGENPLVDAISILKRTGARSIITIGDGSVVNFGKLLRAAVESGKSSTQLFDHLRGLYSKKKLSKNSLDSTQEIDSNIKLISLGHMPSPSFFCSSAISLDNTDDILFENVTSKPDAVGFDQSFNEINPFFSPLYFKEYFLGLLFDVFFSFTFSSLQANGISSDQIFSKDSIIEKSNLVFGKMITKTNLDKLDLSFWDASEDNKVNYSNFIDSMECLVKVRENIESSPEFYPGLTHLATNVTFLESMNYPFSYNIIRNNNILFRKVLKLEKLPDLTDFSAVIDHFNSIKDDDYYQQIDGDILESILVSLLLIEKVTKYPNPLTNFYKKSEISLNFDKIEQKKDGSITSIGLIEQFLMDAPEEESDIPSLFDVNLQKNLVKSDFFNDYIDRILKY